MERSLGCSQFDYLLLIMPVPDHPSSLDLQSSRFLSTCTSGWQHIPASPLLPGFLILPVPDDPHACYHPVGQPVD